MKVAVCSTRMAVNPRVKEKAAVSCSSQQARSMQCPSCTRVKGVGDVGGIGMGRRAEDFATGVRRAAWREMIQKHYRTVVLFFCFKLLSICGRLLSMPVFNF
jgi:hypothetical protein